MDNLGFSLGFHGDYKIVCVDSNGNKKWEEEKCNIVPNEGLTAFLQIAFGKISSISNAYIGLFSNNYTPIATDTAATISTNAGEFTGYSQGSRQSFVVPSTITGTSFDNSANPAVFTCSVAGTVNGAFLVTVSTIGGTTGTLLSAVKFSSSRTLAIGDQINIQYGLSVISQ